jgi:hypothetical protein
MAGSARCMTGSPPLHHQTTIFVKGQLLCSDGAGSTRNEHLAREDHSPIRPPSLRVITIVAERGRPWTP